MQNPYVQALEFLVDAGVTTALMDEPNNRFKAIELPQQQTTTSPAKSGASMTNDSTDLRQSLSSVKTGSGEGAKVEAPSLKAHADVITEAKKIAGKCKTLDDLKTAIQKFDGLSLKKTATQIVFADGKADAKIMVIGEAPGGDEDRQGVPFVGAHGQLLDKILACINLSRTHNVYISNILNWRPPGNRTPTKEEMEIAAPFILKHIDLIKPDYLILCGGVAAQTILKSKDSISRLRGKIHDLDNGIKAIATYHPLSLLQTPLQKKKVWDDMLMLQDAFDG